MKPLIIGQAPGPRKNEEPLCPSTTTGKRLLSLMAVDEAFYLSGFDRVNLVPQHPGRQKRDDRFPMRQARATANALRPLLVGRHVVFLGRNVAAAFGLEETLSYCRWEAWNPTWWRPHHDAAALVAVSPHPSGRCRWFHNPVNHQLAQQFWKSLADRASVEYIDSR